jgi:putative membrane protein
MEEQQISSGAGRKALIKAATALILFVVFALVIFAADPADAYSWLKALHIIAVMSWMAGMLYLPRLFIYHCDAAPNSQQYETFSVMESRLVKVIMNPAMMISWVLGLYLAYEYHGFSGAWLHAKLACVVLLTAVHVYFSKSAKAFARGEIRKTPRHWRMVNEIPTVLMILIVVMAVVKPF